MSAPDEIRASSAVPGPVRLAAALTLLEAVGLVVAAAVLVVKTVTSSPDSLGRALLAALLAVGGAAVLVLCARGVLAGRPAARSPLVVLEILALPVGYSLGIQAGRWYYGVPIIVLALGVLGALLAPASRSWLDRV